MVHLTFAPVNFAEVAGRPVVMNLLIAVLVLLAAGMLAFLILPLQISIF
jgi:hypothetical protein